MVIGMDGWMNDREMRLVSRLVRAAYKASRILHECEYGPALGIPGNTPSVMRSLDGALEAIEKHLVTKEES